MKKRRIGYSQFFVGEKEKSAPIIKRTDTDENLTNLRGGTALLQSADVSNDNDTTADPKLHEESAESAQTATEKRFATIPKSNTTWGFCPIRSPALPFPSTLPTSDYEKEKASTISTCFLIIYSNLKRWRE